MVIRRGIGIRVFNADELLFPPYRNHRDNLTGIDGEEPLCLQNLRLTGVINALVS